MKHFYMILLLTFTGSTYADEGMCQFYQDGVFESIELANVQTNKAHYKAHVQNAVNYAIKAKYECKHYDKETKKDLNDLIKKLSNTLKKME